MLANLTIRKKLIYLLLILMFGLGAECYVIESTVSQVRVHGPAYKRITATKDLIADILPPPAFIIEAYLLAHEQLEEPRQRGATKTRGPSVGVAARLRRAPRVLAQGARAV